MSVQAGDSIPQSSIPEAARLQPGRPFDVEAATRAYLATVPADLRARSDGYTEGGYWIQVWGFLLSAGILVVLLHTGLSRRFRDWAERRSRRRPVQTVLYYWLLTLAATSWPFPGPSMSASCASTPTGSPPRASAAGCGTSSWRWPSPSSWADWR